MNSFKKFLVRNSIIISWLVVAIIFATLGVISVQSSQKKDVLIYGQPDGKIFEGELSQTYEVSYVDFKPLNVPMDTDMQEFIYQLSTAYEIDHTLVMAMIQTESAFDADIVSRGGDYGLMQIAEINHGWLSEALGVKDFLDPYDNVKSGMFILRKLFEKYEEPEKVLMAYNMGETGAARLWDKDIYETNYTRRVLKCQQEMVVELSDKD